MAHALRYYKEIQQDNGQIIRLEIHRKDSTLPAVEIGRVLQALRLDIQGSQDNIDTPIIKTSLTMTFVDAPDLEEGKKCGNWEEFYTPDSTMWMVVLKADGKTIWGGYVTPDSYQEDLRYRGSVTIIARDNIGHMQDFPFDMEGNVEGMVTLQDLVNEAWAKIESPMVLDWRHEADDAMYLLCDGVEAPQTYMNVSAFEDMNFFDAVEKVLYSYGLVMRYTGSNRVTISSLRDLPYQGKSSAPRALEPTFLAHAQRELAPAVRRIEESVKYEFSDGVQIPLARGVTFSGVAYTVPFYSTNVFGETTTKSIPVHAIANTGGEGWSNVPSSTLFFNPKKYTIRQTALAEDAERMLFLACNTDGSHSAIYRKTVVCADFQINMTFGRPVERDSYGGVGYCYGFSDSDDREQNGIGSLSAKSVDCYISREQNGIQQFFDGHTWSADAVLLTIEVTDRQCGIDVPLGDSEGTAEVTLTIVDVKLNDKWDFSDGLGLYIPISSMYWGVAQDASLCETNNINTVYIDTNNVILEHSPELAPALDEVPFPSVIKNGIFVKSGNAYLPAKGWAWSGGTPQQMAVYNHLQLLCYHSKPNNVISGDIVYADFVDMAAIYEWGGANHLLVSGSYNFLNGRIESAVLREFKFYTDMWSDVSGTSLPETEQNNRTTAESGSGAAKASTYSNETTVNIGGTGGGGSGSSTLAGLTDVSIASPTDGQVLMYSVGSGKWINWDKKYTLWGASDVSDDVAEDGQVLVYNKASEMWVPKTISVGDVTDIDFSLASDANNAITLTINDETKYITAAALKASLGLGSLAYKNSLAASDIPSLPWSKITSGKPTTLAGYGITDAVIYQNGIDTATDFKKYGYGHASGGWRGSGPAMIFGVQNYNVALQSSNEATDYVSLYVRSKVNGVEYGWDRLVTEGLLSRGAIAFDTSVYKCLGDAVLHRNSESGETFLNFGVASTDKADLRVFGYNIDFVAGEAYAYKTYLKLYADGYAEFKVPLIVTGSNVGIGTTSPACALDVNGDLNSRNFVKGDSLASDPTDSFQTAIFGSSDSSFYKMRLMRKSTATDGINAAYSPIFAMKTADTHSFLAISYNTKDKCYIGGGSGDAIIWSSILYHNNMDLIPKYDRSYTIGSASLRYKSLAVSDSVQIGDAIISWDAEAGMLKFDKGLYSTGAVTAGGKGSSNKYRLDNWNEWTVDSDGNVTDAKLLESSLSAKLGVELNKRLAEIEESANIGPVKIDLEYIRSATTLTPSQASTAGLTEDVINNMLAGKYTKVIPDNDAIEVWDYTAYGSGNSISIYFTQGDGFMVKSGIEMRRDSITANWNVIYEEI